MRRERLSFVVAGCFKVAVEVGQEEEGYVTCAGVSAVEPLIQNRKAPKYVGLGQGCLCQKIALSELVYQIKKFKYLNIS